MAKSKKRKTATEAAKAPAPVIDDSSKAGLDEAEADVPGIDEPADPEEKREGGSEAKFKIRPRFLAEKDEERDGQEEASEDAEKEVTKRMAWPSKDPFQAKVPEPRVRSSRREASADKVPIEPAAKEAPSKARGKRPALEWSTVKGRIFAVYRSLLKRKAPLVPALAAILVAVIFFSRLFSGIGYERGLVEGRRLADEAATKEKIALPEDVSGELDEALSALRSGDAERALKSLRKLEEIPKGYSSLTYLVALAAMQNGDIDLADQKVKETIAKRERVSDALALASVLVTQKAADLSRSRMGDPRVRSEALLRQAAMADAANPYPRFELATLLRYQGQLKEAAAEVRAAQARLNPMDSHVVMDVTLQLIELEQSPDDKLPALEPQTDDVRKLLPFAYAAMRRGEYSQAVAILEKCRTLLAPDLFDYLVNDPAFRRFARQEELKGIYGN
jgi:tetratricopeptide (TPR) repeat protein